jgi:hypothetical protein
MSNDLAFLLWMVTLFLAPLLAIAGVTYLFVVAALGVLFSWLEPDEKKREEDGK